MGLKKFEDFEHHLAEEDKNTLANDTVNAKKELLNSFDKHGKQFFTKHHLVDDKGGDLIAIATGGEKSVIVKVIGYEV